MKLTKPYADVTLSSKLVWLKTAVLFSIALITQVGFVGRMMIKHIVMWQLKEHAEGSDKVTNALKMKALLDACADIVPGTLAFEVALAQPGYECTYDVVLYSVFESAAALDAYQNHPQHVALKPFVAAVRSERQCMDYAIG